MGILCQSCSRAVGTRNRYWLGMRAASGRCNPAATEPSGLPNPTPSTQTPQTLQRLHTQNIPKAPGWRHHGPGGNHPRDGELIPAPPSLIPAPPSFIHHPPLGKPRGWPQQEGRAQPSSPRVMPRQQIQRDAGTVTHPEPCSSSSKSLSWGLWEEQMSVQSPLNLPEGREPCLLQHRISSTCSSSPQPRDLLSCTQTTPAPRVPEHSPARTPQNQPGFVIREGFISFSFFFTCSNLSYTNCCCSGRTAARSNPAALPLHSCKSNPFLLACSHSLTQL